MNFFKRYSIIRKYQKAQALSRRGDFDAALVYLLEIESNIAIKGKYLLLKAYILIQLGDCSAAAVVLINAGKSIQSSEKYSDMEKQYLKSYGAELATNILNCHEDDQLSFDYPNIDFGKISNELLRDFPLTKLRTTN